MKNTKTEMKNTLEGTNSKLNDTEKQTFKSRKCFNMEKEIDIQVKKLQSVPYRIKPKRNIPRHTVIEMAKFKDKEY